MNLSATSALFMMLTMISMSATMALPASSKSCSKYNGKQDRCEKRSHRCIWEEYSDECTEKPETQHPTPKQSTLNPIQSPTHSPTHRPTHSPTHRPTHMPTLKAYAPETERRRNDDTTRPSHIDTVPEEILDPRDENAEYWDGLISQNCNDVEDRIKETFSGKFNVYLCSQNERDFESVECLHKDIVSTRVKIYTDEDKGVIRIFYGAFATGGIEDTPSGEKLDAREANAEFWDGVIGQDRTFVEEEINNTFDSYFNIYLCFDGAEYSDEIECLIKNYDQKRVKIETNENDVVTKAILG